MKRSLLLVIVLSLLSAPSAFAYLNQPEDMFGTWEVSGQLNKYGPGSGSGSNGNIYIQPFLLEVGDRTLEDVYGEYSDEQKNLALQALKNFFSANQRNNACGDQDFNQTVQQLARPLYLPFDSNAKPSIGDRYKQEYKIPIPDSYYYDWFTFEWESSKYLWFWYKAGWQDGDIGWTAVTYYAAFKIADDGNSINVMGEIYVSPGYKCNVNAGSYYMDIKMVRVNQ